MKRAALPIRWVAPIALAGAGLAGCLDAVTFSPVVRSADPAPDVPALAGAWTLRTEAAVSVGLRFVGTDARGERCRHVEVVMDVDGEALPIGREVCLTELDGHLIAEVAFEASGLNVYRQFLLKSGDDRIEVCGLRPLWLDLEEMGNADPAGGPLEKIERAFVKLEYSAEETAEVMVVYSDTEAMRETLAAAMDELAKACDGDPGKEASSRWHAFERK